MILSKDNKRSELRTLRLPVWIAWRFLDEKVLYRKRETS